MAVKSKANGKLKTSKKRDGKTDTLGVIGLGYVGLPLVVEMAQAGFHVVGFDIDKRKVDGINAGKSHIEDIPTAELGPLVKSGLVEATTDFSRLSETRCISICV